MSYLSADQIPEQDFLHAHRDDYYMLIILTQGEGTVQCDMEPICIKATGILYIKPSQIHSVLQGSKHVEGYVACKIIDIRQ